MNTPIYERKYGWEQIKREKYIAEHVLSPQSNYPIFYRNIQEHCPLIQIPIELPMYRLENGRTVSKQEEYLAIHQELDKKYFVRDKNSVEVQQVQHQLLFELVQSTELDKYFKEHDSHGIPVNKQKYPIICTPDGFVVNGNRRLCCWRALYYEDPVKYGYFKYIQAAILPVFDEDAILELETELQIAPDIQADYTWHAEALMMQRLRDKRQYNIGTIAKKFRKKNAKEAERLINMRALAAEYLAWKGPEFDKRWSKVDDNEYAFRELVDQMSRINSPMDKELFKYIGFTLISSSERDSDYRRIKDAKKYLNHIIQDLKSQFLPGNTSSIPEVQNSPDNDPYDLLMGGVPPTEEEGESSALLPIIGNISLVSNTSEIVEDTIDREKLFDKAKQKATYIVEQVRSANTMLQSSLSIDLRDPALVSTGLKEQLDAIEKCVAKLREWLSNRET